MTDVPPPTLPDHVQEANRRLLRRLVLGLAAAAVVLVVLAGAIGGMDGFLGALVAVGVVGAFFGVDVVLLRSTAAMPPLQVMAVVVMVYTFKVTLLAIFLVALRGTTAFSATWFAVVAIALTTFVLGCAVVLLARWKRLSVEPGAGA